MRYLANKDGEVQFPEEYSKGYYRAIDNLDQTPEVLDYYTNIENEHESRIMSSINWEEITKFYHVYSELQIIYFKSTNGLISYKIVTIN